jgi:hypothetical protein
LGNRKYLLVIALLSVLTVTIASNSFQRVYASPEREACVTTLLQNPEVDNPFNILSDAVICLSLSESDATGAACVGDLAQAKAKSEVMTLEMLDGLVNGAICLAQDGSGTTLRGACVSDLVRLNANPESTIGELVEATSDAVICLARI